MNLQQKQLDHMTIGEIAARIPGATAVLRRYDLDFCCAGKRSLDEALAEKDIDRSALMQALEELAANDERDEHVPPSSIDDYKALVEFIVERYHETHRRQFPELIRLAERVEKVHGTHPQCPTGLTQHLQAMFEELSTHMEKEEIILFPMLCQGQRNMADEPISAMESEHEEHGRALKFITSITQNYTPPEGACNTWKALYQGLKALEDDLIAHIHLENNILFARQDKATDE